MELVTAGLMNKQIAAELGLSEITVKIHRGNVMKKMVAKSLADLVKMAEYLELVLASDSLHKPMYDLFEHGCGAYRLWRARSRRWVRA